MINHLFVYGTLRSPIKHPMHQVLVEYAQFIGMGTVQGCLFNVGDYPGLVLSQKTSKNHSQQGQNQEPLPSKLVLGEIYALYPDTCQTALALLDDYETCGPKHTDAEYWREVIPIQVKANTQPTQVKPNSLLAWTYLYNRDPESLTEITCGDYVTFINNYD